MAEEPNDWILEPTQKKRKGASDTHPPSAPPTPPSQPAPPPGLRLYLRLLDAALNCLEFGDPSELLKSAHRLELPKSKLDQIWVSPLVREVPIALAMTSLPGQAAIEIPFERALEKGGAISVLLAAPGGGKSTICRYLACKLAATADQQGAAAAVPLYIPLRALVLDGHNYEDALIDVVAKQLGAEPSSDAAIRSALVACFKDAFVIFDGLDEIPAKAEDTARPEVTRTRILEAVRYLVATYPSIRCLVTCREAEYPLDPSSIFSEAAHFLVVELSPPQVKNVIDRWHAAAAAATATLSAAPPVDWQRRAVEVREFIRSDADIGHLVSVPLLLNMLQLVFSTRSETPRSVSQLAARAITFLMFEKPKMQSAQRVAAAGQHRSDVLLQPRAHTWLTETLQQIGYTIQTQILGGTRRGLQLHEVQSIALSVMNVKARDFGEMGLLAFGLTHHILQGHGVLVLNSTETWDFTHNVFREVLAGQALDRLRTADRVGIAEKADWLLPLRYWAGTVARDESGISQIFMMASELTERFRADPQDHVNLVLSAAEIICETEAASDRVGPLTVLENATNSVRKALLSLLDVKDLPLPQRIRTGDLLGVLGDPRLGHSFAETRFVAVPSGTYTIGRAEPHAVLNVKYGECPAAPRVPATLHEFRVGLFPVTNRDFAEFMSDGGYEREELWLSRDAIQWLRQEPAFLDTLRQLVDQTALKHFMTDITAGRVTRDELGELRDRILKRREPMYWFDPRFNRPNQPVVGVNWWEAVAFCAWAELKLRHAGMVDGAATVCLPTEGEWEAAARGAADISPHPWGTDPPEGNAHVRSASGIARTAGVGLFPWASYPAGPLDMVGNVWEWTVSKPGLLTANAFVRGSLAGYEDRVVRGSSWLSSEPASAEVTFRSFDPPCNAYEDLGFRVAIADSEAVE